MRALSVFIASRIELRYLVLFSVALILTACGETLTVSSNKFVDRVEWNAQSNMLQTKGHLRGDGSTVSVTNADTSELLGKTLVTNQHYWKLDVAALETIPCTVNIVGAGKTETVKVQNAPADCNKPKVGSRAIIQSAGPAATRAGVSAGSVRAAAGIMPDGVITSPTTDVTIMAGDSVTFLGNATSTAGSGNFIYLWTFDGASPALLIQNPGAVTFNTPGVFRISLTVSNNNGSDPLPATRTITVLASSAGVQASSPIANIDTPTSPQSILVGDSLFFAGSGFDPAGSGLLTYNWNFDGAVPNSNSQVPGLIKFTQPGIFNVSLTVTDAAGNRNLNAAEVQITVTNLLASNLPPVGLILGPNSDLTIVKNTGIFFQGLGIDADRNEPLTYIWSFGGAAPDSMLQNPGIINFTTPGTYVVSLLVIDALGLPDPNPPTRVITVNDVGVNNNDFPESTILSPAGDIQVLAGDTVIFAGEGVSPTGNDPLSYAWDFGHPDIPPSDLAIPGEMIFDVPGVYEVTFTVTDSLNQADPTPAVVVITVSDPVPAPVPGPGPTPTPPPAAVETIEGEILSPRMNLTVEAGTSIDFEGAADDVAPGATVTYLWSFSDPAMQPMLMQNATVVFNTPGEVTVTLFVGDDQGNFDLNPPSRTITVVEAGTGGAVTDPNPNPNPNPTPVVGAADAPTGFILMPNGEPAMDMTISVGDSIQLVGMGTDPNGSALTYFWDIDGGAGNSTEQMPGAITFANVGVWDVELTVTNAEGISDPNPPSITITVEGGDPANLPPP